MGTYDAPSGSTLNASFISGFQQPAGIAVSGERLFVADFNANTVGVYNAITGAAINASLVTGLNKPFGVALSGNRLYVTNDGDGTVGVYNAITGAPINASLITGLSVPKGIAVSGNNLFVANESGNTVGEYNATTGAAFNASFITGLSGPIGLVVFGNKLYVANANSGSVGEYDTTTGAAVNASFVTGVSVAFALGVSDPGTANLSQLSSPAPASTLSSGNVTFDWTTGSGGVTDRILGIGSTPGGFDIFAADVPGSSATIKLPTDGRRLFARLFSKVNGEYQFNAYTFDTVIDGTDPKAAMQSPPNGSTFTSGSVTFQWSAGTGVSEVVLWVGDVVDTFNLHAAVEKGNSATVTLPTDGRPIYVALFSKINGVLQVNRYVYTAAMGSATPAEALITAPANGSILTSPDLRIKWSAGSAATAYALWVGSKPKGVDIYAAFESSGDFPKVRLPLNTNGTLDGRRIFVTQFSLINGAWQTTNYYFDTSVTWTPTSQYINAAQ